MSFQPFNKNASGIAFFGTDVTDPVYDSNSNFTIDGTSLRASNLKISDGGNIGTDTTAAAITIASDGDISIAGNLTVNGTTTTVATETLTVEDPLIALGSGNDADISDLGFFGEYSDDGGTTAEFAGLFRDAGDEKFKLFHSLEEKPTSTVNTGGTGYTIATLVANVEGNVTGNADTATEATNVTLSDSADENAVHYLVFADGATGTQGLETDAGVTYNPSTNIITATRFQGSADTLTTSRNFSASGEVLASAVGFDGSDNVSFNMEIQEEAITNQTAKGAAAASDLLLIIDSDDSNTLKKITRANLISGLGGFSNFVVSDRVTTGQVDDGEEVIFMDGPTINFTVGAEGGNHTVSGVVVDGSIDENKLATSVAGDGLTGGGGSVLAVGAGTLIDVQANQVDVDLNEAPVDVVDPLNDSFLFIDADTTAKQDTLSDLFTAIAGTGLAFDVNGEITMDDAQLSDAVVDVSTDEFVLVQPGAGMYTETLADLFQAVDGNGLNYNSLTNELDVAYSVGTANSSVTISNNVTLATAGAGGITLTLPTAVGATGYVYVIKKVDTAAGTVTIDGNAAETIDGAATKVLYFEDESITVVSDNSNWHII